MQKEAIAEKILQVDKKHTENLHEPREIPDLNMEKNYYNKNIYQKLAFNCVTNKMRTYKETIIHFLELPLLCFIPLLVIFERQ